MRDAINQIPQLSPNTAAWLPWPEQRGLEGTIVVVDRDGLTWDRLRVRPTTDERALGPMQPPGVATTMRFIGHP